MTHLLGGRYDLQEQIGGGGMAVVYRAVDTMLGRQVAVKMLRSQFAGDEEFIRRFRREAQSAASLSHPNIVNLYDVGVTEHNEYYIVMEYVDGPTLKDVIRERGPLPVDEAVAITEQICDALEQAHTRHIVHRDIKPHNILLTSSGQVKVTDFGIARAITGNTITHHPEDPVLGSVHYFSPEQARGAATDAKSDIYSLGVVMYEMLTKRLPFSGDSPVSIALKHLRDDFVDPREWNPRIPQSVENIILRCLAKSPADRYPDMAALKADLQTALLHPDVPKYMKPRQPLDETIAIPAVGGLRAVEESGSGKSGGDGPRKKRRWWMPLVWTGVTLVVIGVGAAAAYYIVMDSIQTPNLQLPNVTGETVQTAVAKLHNAGFNDIVEKQAVNSKPAGTVYDQSPEGPTEVKPGRTITLWVSKGPQQNLMPNLTDVPVTEAVQTLQNLGVDVKSQVTEQPVTNSSLPAGEVVQTDPAPGTPLTPTTQITLQVSQGQMVTVPTLVGLTLDQAVAALKQANLVEGQVTYGPYPAPDQTVYKTAPYVAGDRVPAGTPIGLWVANNSGEGGGVPGGAANNTTGSGTGPAAGGSSNTTGQGTAMGDSEPKTIEVQVNDPDGKRIHVQIFKSDAESTRAVAVDQVIHGTTSWAVTLVVTPDQPGQVLVYEDGQLEQNYPVPYSN
ncbi:MAG: Stk1 family PASTA domain-containing Ser/Thr kinase [Alicyclobacillus sp.]|nr:Stk1 family PASTA domain-containing Ser/Thr kinase [Alicyclobacillus sp.]